MSLKSKWFITLLLVTLLPVLLVFYAVKSHVTPDADLTGTWVFMGTLVAGITFSAWYFSLKIVNLVASSTDRLKALHHSSQIKTADLKDAISGLSSTTNEQASAIQETVATLDEISAMMNRSTDYVKKSSDQSNNSHALVKEGQGVVEQMILAMEEINKSNSSIMERVDESNKQFEDIVKVITEISEKTKVINDIVFQTKLLSFNASVEAARAGEHGKGFSVVAEEVGNLAHMSGSAAKEIEEMLSGSISKVKTIVDSTKANVSKEIESGKTRVESGVVIAKRCGEVLSEVVENVSEVTSNMNEISNASQEQADGVTNITTAMKSLDAGIHKTTETAEKVGQIAESLDKSFSSLSSSDDHVPTQNVVKKIDTVPQRVQKSTVSTLRKKTSPSTVVSPAVKKPFQKTNVVPLKTLKTKDDVAIKKVVATSGGNDVPLPDDPRFEDI